MSGRGGPDSDRRSHPQRELATGGNSLVQRDLTRWNEDACREDDAFETATLNGVSPNAASVGEQSKGTPDLQKRERAKRAVTSESWDDDFLFQHESSAPPVVSRRRGRSRSPPSRALSESQSLAPDRTRDRPPRTRSPSSDPFRLNQLSNPSLDSLVSSLAWSEAGSEPEDPTITLANTQSTPKFRVPSQDVAAAGLTHEASRIQRSSPSRIPISDVSSPLETQSPRRPATGPSPCVSPLRLPSNATTNRSDTPSLFADSLRSLVSMGTTTADELKTETEDDETEDDETARRGQRRSGLFAGLKRYSREILPSPPLSPALEPPKSKRWRFGVGGRSKTEAVEPEVQDAEVRSQRIFGRRTGPREVEQVVRINRAAGRFEPGLSNPVREGGQVVVLGRRTRTGPDTPPSAGDRNRSVRGAGLLRVDKPGVTPTTAPDRDEKPLPSATQARSTPPVARSRPAPSIGGGNRIEHAAAGRPSGLSAVEADVDELSSEDRPRHATRTNHSRRRSAVTTVPSTANSPRSPTFSSLETRPNSPVESILGDRIGRWNTSQVSFASSTYNVGFHHEREVSTTETIPTTGYETTRPEGAVRPRKRKLVKRRPGSGVVETTSEPALDATDATGQRPLLSAISSRSSGTSHAVSNTSTLDASVVMSGHDRSSSLPFAHDSDRDSRQRPATPSKPSANERGLVEELETGWLGVVPFPPSPSRPRDTAALPARSKSPTLFSPRSTISRSSSGRSDPPITIKTQAETKAKRNSGGLGRSISSMFSRSNDSSPEVAGGREGPGRPVPSAPSAKSSKTVLTRSSSSKGKSRERRGLEQEKPSLPKSPSLSLLKKRSSVNVSPNKASRLPVSNPSTPTSTVRPDRPRDTKIDLEGRRSPSVSSPSFFDRARNLSRSANSKPPETSNSPGVARNRLPSAPNPVVRARPLRPTVAKGQLNPAFRMPRNLTEGAQHQHQQSGATKRRDHLSEGSSVIEGQTARENSTPPTDSARIGHRPSLSLSSIMRSPSDTPQRSSSDPRVQTQRLREIPPTALDDGSVPTEAACGPTENEGESVRTLSGILPRRNSLSDLRIPARITVAQKKIEDDLERVKQFAQGIEGLKALREEYERLLRGSSERAASSHPASATSNTMHGVRRIEIEYSQWWEQAQTLIDLGDGKRRQIVRPSPGTLASRRDRCVSMAVESISSNSTSAAAMRARSGSGSETETEELRSTSPSTSAAWRPSAIDNIDNRGKGTKRNLARVPSASSIETEASVGARQREMLKGVLAPPVKGASLPTRGIPSTPRPGLSVLSPPETTERVRNVSPAQSRKPPSSPSKRAPFARQMPSDVSVLTLSNASRRVSKVGVAGIREFLLRLRYRATQELANSVGTLTAPAAFGPQPSSPVSIGASASPRRSFTDPTSRPVVSLATEQRPSLLRPGVGGASELERRARQSSFGSSSFSSSSSVSDWDAELGIIPRGTSPAEAGGGLTSSLLSSNLRRSRTVSVDTVSRSRAGMGTGQAGERGGRARGGDEMMVLTTENMPRLVDKVRQVHEQCQRCTELLGAIV